MKAPIQIEFTDLKLPDSGTLILLSADRKPAPGQQRKLDKQSGGQLAKAMQASSFEGKKNSSIALLAPASLDLNRVLVVGLGEDTLAEQRDFLDLGGRLANVVKDSDKGPVTVFVENITKGQQFDPDSAAAIANGFLLKKYEFNKYKSEKTKGEKKKKDRLKALTIATPAPDKARRSFERLEAVRSGVFLARDLVNEPGNILGPVEFALKARELESHGVSVTLLDETEMAAKGMNALLAVGQGSERESRLAIMHWNGADNPKEKPLAIVGKGVSFDSGGISIKPSAGMEDMKGDMGGAACVTGLMKTLAMRKAKVNVVGVIGLVENMPDGKAQRPGDVVTSMSGQTIEIINTDAEGRLVLADALTYTIRTHKPKLIIDLATLTGAILVALGKEYAGLFSNNDRLAGRLTRAGEKTGEKVWRMPLGKKYDKLIDSRIADMKNTGGRLAGSTTAAQFLKRYVEDIPWAHLDIAGTAMASPKTDLNSSWGSGFGVRLLNEFIAENYE